MLLRKLGEIYLKHHKGFKEGGKHCSALWALSLVHLSTPSSSQISPKHSRREEKPVRDRVAPAEGCGFDRRGRRLTR